LEDPPNADRERVEPGAPDQLDATRRTHLASERTQLAWWRTGLTAVAVALAVGRVVPELGDNSQRWPYTLVGIGFALYGIALIAYGTRRARAVDSAIARGSFAVSPDRVLGGLTAAGIVLGLATLALVAVN
jgi:putative membrane protein